MAEKKLLKLSDWSKGMLTAASRVDLPLDALFYAENIDFSIPMRQGLLENDAMIGDGGDLATIPEPDHNAVAGSQDFLNWAWLGQGVTVIGEWDAIGVAAFAGDEYIWRSLNGVLYFKSVLEDGAWTTLSIAGETFDEEKEIFATGKNLLIPLDSGYLAAMWDHGVATLPVGNKLLTVSIKWTGDDDGDQVTPDYVWREVTGHAAYTHFAWECVQAHTSSPVTSNPKYLPNIWDEIRDDAYDTEGWAGHPWMEYWKFLGKWSSKAAMYAALTGISLADGDEWAASVAYTSPAATLVVTSAASTYVYNAPSALPIEYVGHEATDTVALYLGGGYDKDGFTLGYNYRRPDGDAAEADWYLSSEAWSVPADNGLIAGADGGGTATGFRVSLRKITSPIPPEGVHPSIYGGNCFLVEPRWEEATTCKYYLIYEHDHGGFSKPVEIAEETFEANTSNHQAMAIQFFANLDKWSESVRRVHVFRVANPDSGDPSREAWLFSVDRAKSNWWQHKTATSNEPVYMLAPTAANPASVDVTAYPYGGSAQHNRRWRLNLKGDMGIHYWYQGSSFDGGESHASGLSAAFMAAADEGIDLAPVLKGGMGIYSFVDYGQDTQETAQTILGVSLEDLLGVTSIDYTQLSFIGEALGRAFYTESPSASTRGPGTVWYSEVERYSIISPLSFMSFKGSGQLIAVESLHSYLLLLFRYKTVILDARSGLDVGWSVVQELNGIGCVGSDCVTRHESQIFWMGSGSVWMWDGAGAPQRISSAIEYPGFSNDMNHSFQTMWLAIDPAKKELLVYLLAQAAVGYFSGWGELYFKDDLDIRGKCMVYSLGGKTWSAETFRGFRTSADQEYKILGKPFILDNYVLISCKKLLGDNYGYLIIRQAYMQFLSTGDSAHITTIPPWKRAVIETGISSLGSLAADKKLKRLHAAFTGPLIYEGRNVAIADSVLDHWDFKIYTFQEWEDTMGAAPWELLSQLSEDYNWDVSTEESEDPGGEKGYHRSIYTKNDLPSRQTRYFGLRLESQGTGDAVVYETMATKVEIGEIEASFAMKAKR